MHTVVYKSMKRQIENKKFVSGADAIARLNMFMAYEQITVEEYDELMKLVEEVYGNEN